MISYLAWNEIVSPTHLRSFCYDIGFFAVIAFHLMERKLVDFSLPYLEDF